MRLRRLLATLTLLIMLALASLPGRSGLDWHGLDRYGLDWGRNTARHEITAIHAQA